jgi:thymidylate synthase (FAD)
MRHHHTTPFEMCEIKFHVRVPMDCWRQWIRHRTANVNEYSTRYSIAIDTAQKTPANEWRLQASGNKQGSEGFINEEMGRKFTQREEELYQTSWKVYQERLEAGIAREQARKDLLLSTYTESYWKIDLHNLIHFLALRMDDHAQYEIRSYANTIGYEVLSKWCPFVWEAFLDYRFQSMAFSRLELDLMKVISGGKKKEAVELAIKYGWLSGEGNLKRNREREEFENKLQFLDIEAPWKELV